MVEHGEPTAEQFKLLLDLGLTQDQVYAFVRRETIVYLLRTESAPGIGMLEMKDTRLRSGIVEINDPGGGLRTLDAFRERSFKIAKLFRLGELELFGAAVVNRRMATR
jgi:hypothetical protein